MEDQSRSVGSLTALELKARLDQGESLVVLDVREDDERAYCAIAVAQPANDLHIPMGQVSAQFDAIVQLAANRPLVVYCHLGQRSMAVAQWLASRGLDGVHNLEGGIDAWSCHVDHGVRRY